MKKTKWLWILLVCFILAGCKSESTISKGEVRFDRESFVLDTIVQFSVWTNDTLQEEQAKDILAQAEQLCRYYENLMSKSIEKSDVYRLNHANGEEIVISQETAYLIEQSLEFSKKSEGHFDITILPVKELWDFKSDSPTVPTKEQIDRELTKVSYQNIVLGEHTTQEIDGKQIPARRIKLLNNAMIDLGGIAKGYIADKLAEMMKAQGVKKGIINLGGNILMIGEKEKGKPWRVGIQNPDGVQNSYIGSVSIVDQSVVTSGVYERYFEKDGKMYHHILNPFLGKPVENDLLSVTILSDLSMEGDALSTTCFVLGLEKGMELIESMDNVEAVFITSDKKLHVTGGISKYDLQMN